MKVFEFDNYKKYINAWIELRPKRGRGELKKISEILSIHTTMASHIFRGDKDLSMEQACFMAEHLGLNELETDYFLTLVQYERSGNYKLKQIVKKRINEILMKSEQAKNRIKVDKTLTEEDRAKFYSSWHYSAFRLLGSISKFQDKQTLLKHFNMPPKFAIEVLEFLLEKGLSVEKEDDNIKMGPSRTHIGIDSPHIWKHHQNWRLKALERHHKLEREEFMLTAPLTISKKDMIKVREKLLQFMEELGQVVEQTEAENLACLNIDWVYVK